MKSPIMLSSLVAYSRLAIIVAVLTFVFGAAGIGKTHPPLS
ncbi:hypothetical protein DES53_102425 [Roseimicrobium gellanilyticum]|uniref:Uncharacterized protein n=1 Tax=Roseimicrobium gellanilyticum TaxID=748857 RepID=A0A366HS05_9BACT|nr:hypothetical protein DES53_102425 [Roseimicrobium gellanilyticum]